MDVGSLLHLSCSFFLDTSVPHCHVSYTVLFPHPLLMSQLWAPGVPLGDRVEKTAGTFSSKHRPWLEALV